MQVPQAAHNLQTVGSAFLMRAVPLPLLLTLLAVIPLAAGGATGPPPGPPAAGGRAGRRAPGWTPPERRPCCLSPRWAGARARTPWGGCPRRR